MLSLGFFKYIENHKKNTKFVNDSIIFQIYIYTMPKHIDVYVSTCVYAYKYFNIK